MGFNCAAVVGLGLIGGSIARDLSAQGVRVLAYDQDSECLRRALADGSIAAAVNPTSEQLAEAEVVILAVPVGAAPDMLEQLAPHTARAKLITDVGSTKGAIVRAAERCGLGDRFIGSHPLCGDHRSGWSAARRELFRGANVYICPTPERGTEALNLAADLWTRLGAHPITLSPSEHDQMMAWVSHLPQVTATALALALKEGGFQRDELGPGGLEMTRLAGSSPEMWSGILRENRDQALEAVSAMIRQLEALRSQLAGGESDGVDDRLRAARDWATSHIPCKGGTFTRT